MKRDAMMGETTGKAGLGDQVLTGVALGSLRVRKCEVIWTERRAPTGEKQSRRGMRKR